MRESFTGRVKARLGYFRTHKYNAAIFPESDGSTDSTHKPAAPRSQPTLEGFLSAVLRTITNGAPTITTRWRQPCRPSGRRGSHDLPDPLIMTNGLWYNGTPYWALTRSSDHAGRRPCLLAAPPEPDARVRYRLYVAFPQRARDHTNDVFPGGMLMMMLVDPYVWNIDETL